MPGAPCFETYALNGMTVIVAPPELDIANAGDLRAALLDAAAHSPTVIVDMTATEFCDSSAMHVLLRAAERMARDHGGLRLVVATPLVLRLLAVLGVDRVLAIFPSVIAAVSSDGPFGVVATAGD